MTRSYRINLFTLPSCYLSLCAFFISFLLIHSHVSAANSIEKDTLKLVVRPNKKEGEPAKNLFKNKLLDLILHKTKDQYGDYEFEEYENRVSQSRVISMIQNGKVFRVIATMDSIEREKAIWPVKIPIYKGLLGHRIFIIRQEDQNKFSKIKSIEDLQAYVAVQGHDWPDSDILESNGFKLHRAPSYSGIFEMISAGRGDYFPRGLHEPWGELERNSSLFLAVENTLLLKYDAPFYFFVRHGDVELHNRIKEGFLMAIEDGSYHELFYNDPEVRSIFQNTKIQERRIFRIDNPTLPKDTPLDKKDWWYQVGEESKYYAE